MKQFSSIEKLDIGILYSLERCYQVCQSCCWRLD